MHLMSKYSILHQTLIMRKILHGSLEKPAGSITYTYRYHR